MIYLPLSNARCRQFGESLKRSALLGRHASKENSAHGDGLVELRSNCHVIACYAAWAQPAAM